MTEHSLASCLGPVRNIRCCGRNIKDQFVVVIGDDVGLVSVDPFRAALTAVTHLGINNRHDTVLGDTTANVRTLPVIRMNIDVLIDDAFQQFTSLNKVATADSRVEDRAGRRHQPTQLGASHRGIGAIISDQSYRTNQWWPYPQQRLGCGAGAPWELDRLPKELLTTAAIA